MFHAYCVFLTIQGIAPIYVTCTRDLQLNTPSWRCPYVGIFEQPPEKWKQDKIFKDVEWNKRSISYLYAWPKQATKYSHRKRNSGIVSRKHNLSAEQNIWNECARFITNSIIYYQAYILSALLTQKENEGKKEEVDLIKRISPIAWQNVNLLGRFEFHKSQTVVNIDEMISLIEQKNVWRQPNVKGKILA